MTINNSVQLLVDDEADAEIEHAILRDFYNANGILISELITAEYERNRRTLTKVLIAKVIEFTREY